MAEAIGADEILVRIPSRLEILDVVDKVASAIAEHMEFPEEEANSIANSVIEAGTNAIQHGHFLDADLPVDFLFQIGADALRVRVSDQGPGFDVEAVLRSDPTSPDSLLASRGRGIFIMKSLMDEVSFEMLPRRGCTVVLTKRLKRGS
ncbi:MAG: ATP-binding protein [Candidatus Eisenbacteria bacterium]|uniref:ATP-binding protein n=1 Tax=Eiseniibacteriota bacterium TaxID=2212470 RepID=A0A937X834_UNCEI|nr:ATP-binding protein [Candidatus Eisenbacteria bacterium]